MKTKKIYIVVDYFNGTDNESTESVQSVWENANIAYAVAASCYAHSVKEMEVNVEGTPCPQYAQAALDHLSRWRQNNPTKRLQEWEYEYRYNRTGGKKR